MGSGAGIGQAEEVIQKTREAAEYLTKNKRPGNRGL